MAGFRRDLLKNIALALLSTTFFLFLIEMVLRVTEVVPSHTLEYATPEMWRSNPGPLRPGQSFTDRFKRELPFRLTVNNLGFRGAGVPLQKQPGAFRVLCLGDSYTFGAYVDDTETWPAQLDAALREALPGAPIEVINAGISGFTIVDELSFLKEHGLDLAPDAVVLAFVLNDLADLTRRVSSREMLLRASRENVDSMLGPVKTALRQTALYNALFLMKARLRKSAGTDPTLQEIDIRHLLHPPFDERTEALFAQYRTHLSELKSLLDPRGISFVLMVFPYWEQIHDGASDEAQRRLLEMCRDLGVEGLDLLPAFRRYDPKGRKFFHMPWDHHPSARGYRRAALELSGRLAPHLTRASRSRSPGAAPGP